MLRWKCFANLRFTHYSRGHWIGTNGIEKFSRCTRHWTCSKRRSILSHTFANGSSNWSLYSLICKKRSWVKKIFGVNFSAKWRMMTINRRRIPPCSPVLLVTSSRTTWIRWTRKPCKFHLIWGRQRRTTKIHIQISRLKTPIFSRLVPQIHSM